MRRLLLFAAVCLLLTGFLCLPASAETAASSVELQCSVSSSGDCLVSMTVLLRLEAAQSSMTFPLPLNATGITMNGSSVSTSRSAGSVDVDISRIVRDYVGEATIRLDYTLSEAVQVNADRELELELPLLSSFDYPVESLRFTVTMPGSSDSFSPEFSSTYRQSSVAADLSVVTSGSQITGYSTTTLNDHDALTMTMIVPTEMFPTVSTYIREGNPEIVPMAGFAIAALVYWLIFLFALPLRRERTATPPEGLTAGELGCRLTLVGGDLTMMVFTWAQLGYVLLQLDGNGRVLLHKRMDMGNERSAFENTVFRWLFGSRRMVDGTGDAYARLSQRVAGLVPNERSMYRGSSGNVKIFRALACVSQIFCGICVAMNMTTVTALEVLMSLILGAFGAVSAWLIQDMAYRTHLRGKIPVYLGLACCAIWLVLGLLCGQVWIPLCCCLGEWAMGYFAAYGGRRSDLGRHEAGLVLGFRHYVKHLPREDVSRLLRNDPDYFFNLAPYALALGVINPFAAAFGRRMLDQCPYLITRVHGKRTAEEWGQLMADVADLMDAKARSLQLEKWLVALPLPERPRKARRRSARQE